MDLISIIVPMYKAAPFIRKCAESLLSQTYENIEYFFVNDCTPDETVTILSDVIEKFPHREAQIHIINMETNQGHANCRNYALKRCNGMYCIQIDSDDYVDVKMIEKMHKLIRDADADICCCDYYEEYQSGFKKVTVPDDMISVKSVAKCKYKLEYSAHWNKLIKTSLIKDSNIYCIDNVNNWVDIGQTLRLRMVAHKIVLCHEPLYYYNCTNPNSVSKVLTEKRAQQMLITSKVLYEFLNNYGKDFDTIKYFLMFLAKSYWGLHGYNEKWKEICPDSHKINLIWRYPITLKQKIYYSGLSLNAYRYCKLMRYFFHR